MKNFYKAIGDFFRYFFGIKPEQKTDVKKPNLAKPINASKKKDKTVPTAPKLVKIKSKDKKNIVDVNDSEVLDRDTLKFILNRLKKKLEEELEEELYEDAAKTRDRISSITKKISDKV